MHKILYLLITLSTPLLLIAQQERTILSGYITDYNNQPINGITVINNQTFEITITNDIGRFKLAAIAGDQITVQPIEYQPIKFNVTQSIIDQKLVQLQFKDQVESLQEVVLQGDQPVSINLNPLDASQNNDALTGRYPLLDPIDQTQNTLSDLKRQPEQYYLRHDAFMQSQPRSSAFNLIGLLAAIALNVALDQLNINFNKNDSPRERFDVVMFKNKFETEELTEFLDIPPDNLYEFFYFATDNGLNNEMIQSKNEMQLLQFLHDQSKIYKQRKQKTITNE